MGKKKSNSKKKVDSEEKLQVIITKYLRETPYKIGSWLGFPTVSEVETDCESIGVVKLRPGKKILGKTFYKKPFLLGVICLDGYYNDQTKGTSESLWVFETYGREHLDEAKKIAGEISKRCNIKIKIILESEDPKLAEFPKDLGVA